MTYWKNDGSAWSLHSVDEDILRFKEIAILEWICYVKPNPLKWESLKEMPFANPIRHNLVGGSPMLFLKSLLFFSLC